MARKIEVNVDGIEYLGITASAKNQVEMLQIASRTGLLPVLHQNINDASIVSAMTLADPSDFKILCKLALEQIVRAEDKVPVAENLFQDAIHNWFLLVGKVVQVNLGPFWQLIAGSGTGEEKTE